MKNKVICMLVWSKGFWKIKKSTIFNKTRCLIYLIFLSLLHPFYFQCCSGSTIISFNIREKINPPLSVDTRTTQFHLKIPHVSYLLKAILLTVNKSSINLESKLVFKKICQCRILIKWYYMEIITCSLYL